MNRVEKLLDDNSEAIKKRRAALKHLSSGDLVHITGVCGTATGSLASLLVDKGFRVSGSDKAFYPPMGEVVKEVLEEVFEGYSDSNISDSISLAVVGNSIRSDNPEVKALQDLGIPYVSLPEAISFFLIGSREECPTSIVCSGTHGKTTTSAATSFMLEKAGRAPGFFIGGVVDGLDSQVRTWSPEKSVEDRVVVLEGDEYDSAFFEKWSKFHAYRPDILVITSLEFDHADIFSSIEDIKDEFEALVNSMPAGSRVLACSAFPEVLELQKRLSKRGEIKAEFLTYGERESDDFSLSERVPEAGRQGLLMSLRGEELEFKASLIGEYNAFNLLAAASVGKLVGLEDKQIAQGLSEFEGARRRQQLLVDKENIKLIEDFAHHPTAVRLTVEGIRESYPDWNVIAVFEPRSNTSRRALFQVAYSESFDKADAVFLKAPPEARFYSKDKTEEEQALDTVRLAGDIEARGTKVSSFEDSDLLVENLPKSFSGKDVIILMSNGSFDGVPARLRSLLA